uniref:Uncharacterized protein LOC111138298 isoform X2 n=1 Tax=Crassostrea virginica TaxID=6565 RepID=A0A8B8F0N4_CRAVI|nr:uncharacterized protein LOC111138298 isoform X2 [Crassostrea virginica]
MKGQDEDGDMITFSSQEELNEAINGELEKFDIYIQGLGDTIQTQQDRTPPPAEEKPKTFISPESLPDILSEINITRKLKRRFRRCGRKRSSRYLIPAADCYPTNQKSRCRQRQKDISKSLAAMCISENNL